MFSVIVAALCARGLSFLAIAALAVSLAATTGDPTSQVLDPLASKTEREALRRDLALDQPITARVTGFIGSAVAGNLGRSWQSGQQVTIMIADAVPATNGLTDATLQRSA